MSHDITTRRSTTTRWRTTLAALLAWHGGDAPAWAGVMYVSEHNNTIVT